MKIEIENKIIEACIKSALDIMKLNLVNIETYDNEDGTKEVDLLIESKVGVKGKWMMNL